MHAAFMAFVLDDPSYSAAKTCAEELGWPRAAIQQGGLDLLGDMLVEHAPPKLLLLDLDDQSNPGAAAERAIGMCGPDCHIIFLGRQNDINLYRQCVKLGALDYLAKPLADDALMQALKHGIEKARQEKGDAGACRIIPVIGTRGGVGTTTLATNLAMVIAEQFHLPTGILDLDLTFGATALALDREAGSGMRAALENPERLDGLLIASSMVEVSKKLSLLCSEEGLGNPLDFDSQAVVGLIKPIRQDFNMLLVDLPRHMLSRQTGLLTEAAQLVLVTDLSLVSLRDARRMLRFIKDINPHLMPLIVLNRTQDAALTAIEPATFEKNLESKIDLKLPEDAKLARQAAMLGKTMVTVLPDAPFSKGIITLACMLSGVSEETKKAAQKNAGSLFKGLFGSEKNKDKGAVKGTDLKPITQG